MTERQNAILDMWAEGIRSGDIAAVFNLSRGYICNIVLRARDAGDARAIRRRRSRYA